MSLAYRWPRNMETLLIEFLESHPNYWDTKNRDYYNRTKRRQVLNNANKMLSDKGFSVDVNSINKKFKNLRTMFTKEHNKKSKSQITSPENIYEPIWEHYNNLLFLRGSGTLSKPKKSKEIDRELSSADEDLPVDVAQEVSAKPEEEKRNFPETNEKKLTPNSPKSKNSRNNRKRKSCTPPDTEYTTSSKQKYPSSTCLPSSASLLVDDEPHAFGAFVTHKLRCLSTVNQTKAQTEIMAILQKYVLQELDENS